MNRLYLSPPHMGDLEMGLVQEAFASNWIAPLGPHVDAFEREFAQVVGVPNAVALSSGTAALHLALRLLGIGRDDRVLCPTLTFCATANPILYEGGLPVFIDADPATWNLDPNLVREELRDAAERGQLPRAAIAVDLYGQCADYDALQDACDRYEVPLLVDAAESLGASYRGRPAGAFGKCAAYSFNGNKIITTSGGGMLVSRDAALVEQARFLATQARDPAPHYQHSRLGHNYRLSNVLAAIGRGQLRVLGDRVGARRRIFERYRAGLADLPGISFMPQAPYGQSNAWLTCILVDPALFGASRDDLHRALEVVNIEARPLWKPLHLQPLFAHCPCRGGAVALKLFESGLCLPSGSAMTEADLVRVVDTVRSCARPRLKPCPVSPAPREVALPPSKVAGVPTREKSRQREPLRLVVLLSGGGGTLQSLIDRIADGTLDARITRVISDRAGVLGLSRALQAGIPVAVVPKKEHRDPVLFSERILALCRQDGAELVCMAGLLSFLRIPQDFHHRVLNIHPSLIPAFCGKGMYGSHVHEAVLASGVRYSGCTVHFADNEYDHGPIILQRAVPVLGDDTPDSLASRVFEQGCQALCDAVQLFAEQRLLVQGSRVRILPLPLSPRVPVTTSVGGALLSSS